MLRCLSSLLVLLLCLPALAAKHLYYTGVIGGTLKLQGELAAEKVGLTGSYYYDAIGDPLTLKGTLGQHNAATLKEYDAGHRYTGRFVGTFTPDYRAYTGTWQSADGKRKLPFTLTAVAEDRTLSVEKGRFHLTGQYPYFLGASPAVQQVNKLLYGQVTTAQQRFQQECLKNGDDSPRGLTQDYTISIVYYQPELVSLRIAQYEDVGAAHPNTNYFSANYALDPNARLLGLHDLCDAKATPRPILLAVVKDRLRAMTSEGDFTTDPSDVVSAEDLTGYTLTPRALRVAVHVMNSPLEVDIPYPDLLDLIHPQGPLQPLLHAAVAQAAKGKDAVTKLTADEAAEMEGDVFVGQYTLTTKDETNLGIRRAYHAYAALLAARNLRQAAALPAPQRQQYMQTRRLLARLLDTQHALTLAESGGGTMYLDCFAVDAAEQEETLQQVTAALQHPDRQHPKARTRATENLRALNAQLPRPATDQPLVVRRRDLLTALGTALATLPDPAADAVTCHLHDLIPLPPENP